MGWLDEGLRGLGAFATGGISEAAIGAVQAVQTGSVDKLGGALITGVTGPVGALAGAAVAGTAAYAGLSGDAGPLTAVTSLRDRYTGTIQGGLQLAGAAISAGAALGSGSSVLKALGGATKQPAAGPSDADRAKLAALVAQQQAAGQAAEDARNQGNWTATARDRAANWTATGRRQDAAPSSRKGLLVAGGLGLGGLLLLLLA